MKELPHVRLDGRTDWARSPDAFITRFERTVLVIGLLAMSLGAQATSANYQYDELGRLIEISTSDGQTSQYKYDDAGNLQNIVTVAVGAVTINDFTPRQGPVATSVVIKGSGFNPAAQSNAVSFNGVAAVVTSATTTQLVVTVPAGATSGAIKVSNGTATATSTLAFTVTTTGTAPAITSFTPNVGAAGDALALAGTGFDLTPNNDRIYLGATLGVVKSATAQALQLTVPAGAGSGPITLSTPTGSTHGTGDFYAVPAGYQAGSIQTKGRVVAGGATAPFAISSAGSRALVLFDADKDQYLTLAASNSTFASMNLLVYDPHGQQLSQAAVAGAAGGLQLPRIPLAGTYTVVLDPGSSVGQATLGVALPTPGTITTDGVAKVLTVAGLQTTQLAFNGKAGDNLTLQWQAVAGVTGTVSMVGPGGTVLVSGAVTTGSAKLAPVVLPMTDAYSVLVQTPAGSAGKLTLTIVKKSSAIAHQATGNTP